jgi:hypothetical protein
MFYLCCRPPPTCLPLFIIILLNNYIRIVQEISPFYRQQTMHNVLYIFYTTMAATAVDVWDTPVIYRLFMKYA